MAKIILLSLLICILAISNCYAYTLEVTTLQGTTLYEEVMSHKFIGDFLVIQILDGFDNYKVMIKKSMIIQIKVEY